MTRTSGKIRNSQPLEDCVHHYCCMGMGMGMGSWRAEWPDCSRARVTSWVCASKGKRGSREGLRLIRIFGLCACGGLPYRRLSNKRSQKMVPAGLANLLSPPDMRSRTISKCLNQPKVTPPTVVGGYHEYPRSPASCMMLVAELGEKQMLGLLNWSE